MDLELLARGEREQFEQANGVAAEEIVGGDRDPPAIEGEAAEPLRPPADGRQGEAEALLAQLLVELGEEQAGEVADRLGVDEVELHEALDRGFPGAVGVVHDLGDARLIFETQPLLGAAGEQVQVAAHRPEEALGAVEPAEFRGAEQPRPDQVGRALDAMHIFADPVERVEVAQPALAVLDVRFDDVAAVAHADVALVALGELGRDEFRGGACDNVLAEAAHGLVEQALVAPQPATLEEGGADRHVLPGKGDQLALRADRMADLELQVPQQMEHRFGRALGCRGRGRWRSGP